jgi:hypothetical protein
MEMTEPDPPVDKNQRSLDKRRGRIARFSLAFQRGGLVAIAKPESSYTALPPWPFALALHARSGGDCVGMKPVELAKSCKKCYEIISAS